MPFADKNFGDSPSSFIRTRLNTASRSRVSVRGRRCKNSPHSQIDHHANFIAGSHIVCANVGGLKTSLVGLTLGTGPGRRPRNNLLPTCAHTVQETTKFRMEIKLDVRYFFPQSTTNADLRYLLAVANLLVKFPHAAGG